MTLVAKVVFYVSDPNGNQRKYEVGNFFDVPEGMVLTDEIKEKYFYQPIEEKKDELNH